MAAPETPADVRRWFLAQVQALWPVAGGSVSLRKSPCVRPRCAACAAGEQHASYVLYARHRGRTGSPAGPRSEEHTSELQSRGHLVCRLLLEKKKKKTKRKKDNTKPT